MRTLCIMRGRPARVHISGTAARIHPEQEFYILQHEIGAKFGENKVSYIRRFEKGGHKHTAAFSDKKGGGARLLGYMFFISGHSRVVAENGGLDPCMDTYLEVVHTYVPSIFLLSYRFHRFRPSSPFKQYFPWKPNHKRY